MRKRLVSIAKRSDAVHGLGRALDALVPVYETLPGWSEDIRGCRTMAELPANCLRYIAHIEELIGLPVELVSVGPGRSETIVRGDLFTR